MSPSLGLLGGTFDPPHRGHLAMAHAACETIGLDRVFLAPAAVPPHKGNSATETPSPAEQRMAMAALAVAETPQLGVYRDEAPGKSPSYTVDLLRRFRAEHGSADVYFIVGADSFRDLPTWKDPAEVLSLCTLVVFPRDTVPVHTSAEGALSVVVFDGPRVDVSSHEIRARVARGEAITGLVPDSVAGYIVDHRLYHTS